MKHERATWRSQGHDEIIVEAPAERIWNLLADSQRLPEWMPVVLGTTARQEAIDAVRTCEVSFQGRAGVVVERCVVFDPPRRIGWLLLEDSLGFSTLLRHFSFDFVLQPIDRDKTRLRNASYFEPRNWFAGVLIALVVRRRFRSVRQTALLNLKQLAEGATPRRMRRSSRYW